MLLLEQDPQAVPFGELDGLGEDELRRVGRVELRLDGPAPQPAPGERPRHGVVVPAVGGGVLFEVGARGREGQGRPVLGPGGEALDADLLEDEVPVARAPWAPVGEHLEAQGGQRAGAV